MKLGVSIIAAVCLAGTFVVHPLADDSQVVEPSNYRLQDYRSATPETLRGARVVTTQEAAQIWMAGTTVFIDVLPKPPRPVNLPAATIWHEKPRLDIPRSIWLPDTGYGELPPKMAEYFRQNLASASGGDKAKPLVFYCLRNCWMSWNAAKRAVELGYESVIWFPDGTDGWSEAGLPLSQTEPRPRPE
jgi:PQQ-dependent catabolism-associated CXXCW motif protein